MPDREILREIEAALERVVGICEAAPRIIGLTDFREIALEDAADVKPLKRALASARALLAAREEGPDPGSTASIGDPHAPSVSPEAQ
jgi:hypothetical protein